MKELTDKITRAEDMPPVAVCKRLKDPLGLTVELPWWLRREWARIETGVYPESTQVVTALNQVRGEFAIHISKEDNSMVAYTPDKASGENDRQVRTSLARLVTKLYPHLSDNYIRDLNAQHLGELDFSFEELTGEAMIDVYRNGSVGACMSKSPDRYIAKQYPTLVYDMPNISMAVLRNEYGDISARSMLYCPSPEDKRFIRVYGDTKLITKLKRSGYRAGTWIGAEFKVIPASVETTGEIDAYIMPYLDGSGSLGSSEHSNIAMIDNKIIGISRSTATKLNGFKPGSTACATSTLGYVRLTNVDSSEFTKTCYLTGKAINILDDATYEKFRHESTPYKSNKFEYICSEAINIHNLALLTVPDESGYSKEQFWMSNDTPRFTHNNTVYLDCSEVRIALGYFKLSPAYYEESEWLYKTHSNHGQYADTLDGMIKTSEAVYVVNKKNHYWQTVHESVIGKGYKKLHSTLRNKLCYAEPGVETVKTVSGRVVVPELYPVSKMYNGLWDFDRNLKHSNINGTIVHYPKNVDIHKIFREGSEYYTETVATCLGEGWNRCMAGELITRRVSSYIRVGVEQTALYRLNKNSLWKYWTSLKTASEVLDSEFGRTVVKLMDIREAEAKAIDYNLPVPEALVPEAPASVGYTLDSALVSTQQECLSVDTVEAF